MSRYFNPQPKDGIKSSGGYKNKGQKKPVSPQTKGKNAEHRFGKNIAEQLGDETGYICQNQAIEGGGMNNSDLKLKNLPGWAVEIKDRDRLAVPFWWRKLNQENKGPHLLGFNLEGEDVILFRVEHLLKFVTAVVEAVKANQL